MAKNKDVETTQKNLNKRRKMAADAVAAEASDEVVDHAMKGYAAALRTQDEIQAMINKK